MRDHHRLRSRIALLAGLATVPVTGCSPPPKPEKTQPTAERADGGQRGTPAERAASREGGKRPLSPTRLKYYQKKAEEEGKPLSEVVPDHFELPPEESRPQVRTRPERFKTVADAKIAATKRPTPRDDADAETEAGDGAADDAAADERTAAQAEPPVMVANHAPDASELAGYPGDPPFIDGYNPEEATCPSGNWCGDKASASAIGILEATEDTMGCVMKIAGTGKDGAAKIEGKKYEGLSSKGTMQGAFNAHGTELARAEAGNDGICCYHWFEYCSGRPHMDASGPVVAEVIEGETARGTWQRGPETTDVVSDELRARLAAAWRRDALAEHASIASFARATLELLSVGAPADLVARCQQAGLDEVDHAQRCFALASRYGAAPIAPGPLPALSPRAADLARLAADTFAEGCVAESIAALVAERSAGGCADEALRECLTTIADDETRHAALAWATVRWAIAEGGETVATAVRERAATLRPPADPLPDADAHASTLAAHGRLDARAHTLAARDAWSGIIDPLLGQLA